MRQIRRSFTIALTSESDPLQTWDAFPYLTIMEPWFEWSWLLGIKPIHPNGWLVVAGFWIIEAPLMFAAVGAFKLGPLIQVIAAAVFAVVAFTTFVFVFSKFKD